MNTEIKKYFKDKNFPKPISINFIGRWEKGDCYAVTCRTYTIKDLWGKKTITRYVVYLDYWGDIKSVRSREYE